MAGRVPVSGEFYRHFKGKLYQIVAVAKDCNSGQPLVVYQALYEPYQCWARELREFISPVDREKYPDAKQAYRFERVQFGNVQGAGEAAQAVSGGRKSPAAVSDNGGTAARAQVAPQAGKVPQGEKMSQGEKQPQAAQLPAPTEEQVIKALKTGQPERYLMGRISDEEVARIGFLSLLDAENFHEKRQLFLGLKPYLDQRMLSNIAVALDIVLEDGDVDTQFASLLWCMEKLEHYEGGRLR